MKIEQNTVLSWTPRSLTADGKPFFPVMGEIHYSRVARANWREEILKMKAGGVTILSTYVFWLHHEEIEGTFDFSGNRNVRVFLETAAECGMPVFLRIGPFAHGEARNGGLPDWLLKRAKEEGFRVRCNDAGYLRYADRWLERLGDEVKGMMLEDGGPVIGVQIENEYGHVGGFRGAEGESHMGHLYQKAREIGLNVPYYTATGWGGAVTHGLLPVMGGYCDAPWDPRTTEIEASTNYLFTQQRNDHSIASDYQDEELDVTFDRDQVPYLTAELGGGLMPTRHRRPTPTADDITAMSMCKLGSGVSLLGYYMYHGGTNPPERKTTLQESKATGYPNDLPVLSYDFQAPLNEYGLINDSGRGIRLLASFVRDFGAELCEMDYAPQPGNPADPEDASALRIAARIGTAPDGAPCGYLFISNYVRHQKREAHRGYLPEVWDRDGNRLVAFPKPVDVAENAYFFFPFHLSIGKAVIRTACATPLMILHESKTMVFYAQEGIAPNFDIAGDLDGWKILILSRNEALHAAKVTLAGKEHLLVSLDGDVFSDAAGGCFLDCPAEKALQPRFSLYPEPAADVLSEQWLPEGQQENGLTSYVCRETLQNTASCDFRRLDGKGDLKPVEATGAVSAWTLRVQPMTDARIADTEVAVEFVGDLAEMHALPGSVLEKRVRPGAPVTAGMLADHYYTGEKTPWRIGLKNLLPEGERDLNALLLIEPLSPKTPIYLEDCPALPEDGLAELRSVRTKSVYRLKLQK